MLRTSLQLQDIKEIRVRETRVFDSFKTREFTFVGEDNAELVVTAFSKDLSDLLIVGPGVVDEGVTSKNGEKSVVDLIN